VLERGKKVYREISNDIIVTYASNNRFFKNFTKPSAKLTIDLFLHNEFNFVLYSRKFYELINVCFRDASLLKSF